MIRKLKERISVLEAQVKAGSSQQAVDHSATHISMDYSLSPSDQKLCHKILHQFFHGKVENPVLTGT